MYAYLKTQEELSDQKKIASGILLYPKSRKNNINTSIELLSHTMKISCIDLSKPWQDIERDLLEIVESS